MAIAANAVNRLKRNCTITCAVQAFTPKLWCNYAIHFSPYGTSAARPQGAHATRARYCDCSQTTPTDNDCHRRARLHQSQYPDACRTRRCRCCPGHLCATKGRCPARSQQTPVAAMSISHYQLGSSCNASMVARRAASHDGQCESSAGTRSLFFSRAGILNALASMGLRNGTFVAKVRSLKRRAVRSRRGRKTMKRLLTIFVLGSSMLALSACNTVDGAAKDVESVGDCADGVKGNC